MDPVAAIRSSPSFQPGYRGTWDGMPKRTPGRGHHGRVLVGLLVVVATLLGTGGGSVALIASAAGLERRVEAEFQSGEQELASGKSLLSLTAQGHGAALAPQARAHFEAARDHFRRGHALLASSRLLSVLERLPLAGRPVSARRRAAENIAAMGTGLADAGLALADIEAAAISPGSGSAGGALLAALRRATEGGLQAAQQALSQARAAAAQVDPSVLPDSTRGAFERARLELESAFQGLNEFARLAPVLLGILGGSGPRTYLIEQLNPAELRPGGGFLGSFSLITADRGALKVIRAGDAYVGKRPLQGQAGYVAPPQPFRPLIGQLSWSLVDSNFSPDFVVNARWAEFFAERELGVTPDGVIAVDPDAIGLALSVLGPITPPGYQVQFQSQGFAEQLYQLENGEHRLPQHKALLAALVGPMVQRISDLAPSQWPQLLAALNTAAEQRHLQVFFNDPTAEAEMARFGWAGTVNPDGAEEFMMEVEANLGGSKSNHFLSRAYDVTLSRTASSLRHRVEITLVNRTPPDQEYKGSNRNYAGYVRLLLPERATDLSAFGLEGPRYSDPDLPPGVRMIDGWVHVDVDPTSGIGSARVSFAYDTPLPPDSGPIDLYWQKQPGTSADTVRVTWLTARRTFVATGSLSTDLLVRLELQGLQLKAARDTTTALPAWLI